MAIEISKPQPIRIGDRYLYTLTSYEPLRISVTVEVPTDADVDLMLESLAREAGTTSEAIDDEWVKTHALGAKSLAELREQLRNDCRLDARRHAEQERRRISAEELAKRLGQAIPTDEETRYRAMLLRSNELEAGRLGLSLDDLLAQTGTTRAAFDRTLSEEARKAAAQDAAFSAFASERKLKVDDSEIPVLLGLSDAEAKELMESARRTGGFEDLRRQCLIAKASRVVADECTCVYVDETPEAAQKRAETLRTLIETARKQANGASDTSTRPNSDGSQKDAPHLRLV